MGSHHSAATALAIAITSLVASSTAAAEVSRVQVPSSDGTVLKGWVHLPPKSEQPAPVILMSSPYYGQSHPTGGPQPNGDDLDGQERFGFGPLRRLLNEGFALALFSVRGTGESGGCFDWQGRREENDQVELVRWAARQKWSTGKVGMLGHSYMSAPALEALVRAPAPLKAIAVAGVRTDLTTFSLTPQGAWHPVARAHDTLLPVTNSYVPGHSGPPEQTLAGLPVAPDRICPDVARHLAVGVREGAPGSRDAGFYAERRRIGRLRKAKAAVLLGHGFREALAFQEDLVWSALPPRLPKWQLEGQWGHTFPTRPDWPDRLVEWFDHFLRKGPAPERLGVVDYQAAGDGEWRTSASWPPAEARTEALYLSDAGLTGAPTGVPTTVRTIPTFLGGGDESVGTGPREPVCPDGQRRLYTTQPLEQAVTIAGNPYLRLLVTSDSEGGALNATLYDLGPDFGCEGPFHSGSVERIAEGAADLRFHRGNLAPKPFPIGVQQVVRIDVRSLAHGIEAGHRLGVLLAHPSTRYGGPYPATLKIGAGEGPESSHVALPVVEGSAGGEEPGVAPPPRPWAPR